MNDVLRDAYTVLFPAFGSLSLDASLERYLERGGVCLLVGESRKEYVARQMQTDRCASETAQQFKSLAQAARKIAGSVVIAVDQELNGIQRLHRLVPALPEISDAHDMSSSQLAAQCESVARAARELGVNLFLAPIVDVVVGPNPWLEGRTLGADPAEVGRLAQAFTSGVQAAGVAACAKHFPGHPESKLDPAVAEAVISCSRAELEPSLEVFRGVIAKGVKAIMVGPATVTAVDEHFPSSRSHATVELLRSELAFDGLVISDDLDGPGILRGMSIEGCAVAAIDAGVDLLLVSSESGLDCIAESIADAVKHGNLKRTRLAEAASRVRVFAEELDSDKRE
ncbi:glycoside hydrolase family 3 protein [Paraburkholderia sp. Ac-20340]|uniref:glycoside hydrolase family 3 protein n=1 Tax=Paraburkholderia sp. Ac-20340 TaxID=2703888 RepID=UPI00197FE92A|nr:glycoside hydrolase family 3 protein [Paraburkholderia sp. Ac-20340]MBN3854016.1 glycoside hydrolase family 3 protein [Paraburkholderia sp. Ac-20340]